MHVLVSNRSLIPKANGPPAPLIQVLLGPFKLIDRTLLLVDRPLLLVVQLIQHLSRVLFVHNVEART